MTKAVCVSSVSTAVADQQVIEAAGAPIYRKGSGLAQLAKFLQNAQRLRTSDGKQPIAAEDCLPSTAGQLADPTLGPSASSIAK